MPQVPKPVSPPPHRVHATLAVGSPTQAVTLLAQATSLSKTQIKDCMTKGGVWRKRPSRRMERLRRATAQVLPGEILHIYYDPTILQGQPPQLAPILRTPHWSIWAKPPGIPTQGSPWGDHLALTRLAAKVIGLSREAHPVYRLDCDASGLVLLAHHSKSMDALTRLHLHGGIHKRYHAVLHGRAPWQEMTVCEPIGGKPAQSHFRVLQHTNQHTWVEALLSTGRRHQIRIHAAHALGMPIVGDTRFGGPPWDVLMLAAVSLEFLCPLTGRSVSLHLDPAHWPQTIALNSLA
jgi:tRNA pseudouridine32 synthase/23S rRNA pseudouridine746 synthase